MEKLNSGEIAPKTGEYNVVSSNVALSALSM